ncbi:MAG: SBBP repeat-containing protein [Acidobacteriota bacterium]|nr:SBBP repeat-containing protein [Acidobacteriota bacterium]
MHLRSSLPICLLVCCVTTIRASDAPASPHLPFTFVENRGQADPHARYIGTGPDFKAWFGDGGVVFQQGSATERMDFVGGAPAPVIETADPTGARANYLRGNDPARWKTGLPLFGGLRYRGVWPGVEIRFKADSARTKAEYVLEPGADISEIRLRFDGRAEIGSDGRLTVSNASGQFREDKPVLFQEAGAERKSVPGEFQVFEDGTVGFSAGIYDRSKPLIVDPVILFSGYVGGASQTTITSLAVNSFYNIIVAGWTLGSDFSTSGSAQSRNGGGVDAFVAGFSPAGGSMIFCTFLGGSGDDRAFGVTVDASNNTYVTGWTSSANFPVMGALQPRLSGSRDAFITKLNAAGSALVFSTYLGGSGVDSGNSIVLDSTGAVIIAGDTTSANLPVTAAAFQRRLGGAQDAFVAKLTLAGTAVQYLTYYGGSATEHCTAVKVDALNQISFGGSTYSINLPVINAAQPQSGGGQDGFVARLSADTSTLLIGTYLGGSGGSPGAQEQVNGIVIMSDGSIEAVGATSSSDFPVTANTFQTKFGGGNTDGFVSRLRSGAGTLLQSTYFGGSLDDGINAIVSDFDGVLYIAGYTTSPDFPISRQLQGAGGSMDAFVARMTPNRILYGTYLGGNGNDSANAIAIDTRMSVVVAGTTSSPNFPVVGSVGTFAGAPISSFLTKWSPKYRLAVAAAPAFYYDVWNTTGYNGPISTLNNSSFGTAGDIPIVGDWNGTGKKRIGVFRNGIWYLDLNGNGVLDSGDAAIAFGQAGDVPVVGDWTGSGSIKLGLFRNGTFILDLSGHLSGVPTGLSDATFPFGQAGDIPVAADWNSSGSTKVGVFRNGSWLVDYNGDHVFDALDRTYTYGQAGDVPVVGDWNETGYDKIGVYRSGAWILNTAGNNAITQGGIWEMYLFFGAAGYVPLVY